MKKFLSNFLMILILSVIFFPISARSDAGNELEKNEYDPCLKVNCNAVGNYIENLKKAIKVGNKKEVADYMSFPLRINKRVKGKLIHYEVKDKNEFIRQYNSIMTVHVRESILNSDPKDIIPRDTGIGMGNGILWLMDDTPPIKAYVVNVD